MARNLHDKVIIITGASSGIGAATAIACAKAGMYVAMAARRADRLEQVARQVERHTEPVLQIVCDVDRDEDVRRLVDETVENFGRIDAIFANAGYGLVGPILDSTLEQVRANFETNVYGTLRLIQMAVPVMRRTSPQPHVLVCSSAASEIAPPLYGVYAATKAAQDSITQALRAELSQTNVAVSSVHPVGTTTAFFESAHKTGHVADAAELNTPRKLMQTPEYVARTVVRCLRRPRPEVWPSVPARFGVALMTAFPGLAARVLARMSRCRITA